jgi:hypothetical protein
MHIYAIHLEIRIIHIHTKVFIIHTDNTSSESFVTINPSQYAI